MEVKVYFVLLINTSLFTSFTAAIQCIDDEKNFVDWYFIYKLPRIKHEPKFIKGGLAYVYITSQTKEWKFSEMSILNADAMLGSTLKPLLLEKNIFHILYNDEPPNAKSKLKKGHTKGVVLGNEKAGIWLIHSVPHFPNISNHFYPITGTEYGQSFLCVSLNLDNLNKVGKQLQYNQPQIYSQNIPETLKNTIPNLYNAAIGVTIQDSPWYNVLNLTSINGTRFTSFAKARQFNKELYTDLIAPYLNTNLFVESWLNGRGRLPSDCGKLFKIQNVEHINVTTIYINFNSSIDHSKWAVSDNKNNWICIGDINREMHQKNRGGGSLCLKDKEISTNYRNFIQKYENCKI